MKIRWPKVASEYTRFEGGLDLESPAITIKPGSMIAGLNYVCGQSGGYERIDGYERYDGQASPSDATYYYCPCSFADGGPSVGDTITGAVSAETAVVVVSGSDYICVTKLSGDFNDDEVFNVGGNPKGTFTGGQTEKGETSAYLHAVAMNGAADQYRGDISAPTGSGAVRGLALLNGTLYCFRDNAGGTAGLIYKETSSGWSAVTPGSEISFDTGVGEISDGDTITQLVSGATATVGRVVLESGTWAGSDAAGRLILSGITGTFNAVNDLQVGGVTKATATSLATTITLLPGGRYDIVPYNFTGSTATKRLYGCDGVNRGFEFDGSVYVPIETGMTADTPEHVHAYKNQLVFSFKGSSQNSGIGKPYQWTAVTGAAEIAAGDDITGYLRQAQALLIFAEGSTHQLLGSSVDDFALDGVSDEVGAIEWTAQILDRPYYLSNRGIAEVARVQEYGNFSASTVSQKIQKVVNLLRTVAVASAAYKSENQIRFYGSDGTGVSMTVRPGRYGPVYSFGYFEYPDNVACAISGEDSSGNDVVFFGSDEGMVYQAKKGSSFDGDEIEATAFLSFNNSKSPTTLKSYRKAIIEMTAKLYSAIQFTPVFSYNDHTIEAHRIQIGTAISGGVWDLSYWDEFFYDTQLVANPEFSLEGDGKNMGLVVYSKTDIDYGHRLDGAIVHYAPRRLVR